MNKILLFLFIFSFLVGCAPLETSKKARILVHKKGSDTFEYKTVTFKKLESFSPFVSEFSSYFTGTILDGSQKNPMIDLGKKVPLSYTFENGVVIPTTYHSNIVLTHYYYLETLLEFWKKRGLDFYDVHYLVYYEPRMVKEVFGEDFLSKTNGNAAFITAEPEGYKSFAVFAKHPDGQLPVAMNFTIWAHEFGHNIFDKAFAKRDPAVYQTHNTKSQYVLNGMNEGVADFFASVVTQGTIDGVHISIPEGMEKRRLPADFTSRALSRSSSFYEWGTVLASSLFELGQIYGQEKIALQLYKALENLSLDWAYSRQQFNYHHLVKRVLEQVPQSNLQAEYAEVFLKWFNDYENWKEIYLYKQKGERYEK